jgi:hypothetical protein
MPAPAKARAIEALSPEPAPTISASWLSFAMMQFPSDGRAPAVQPVRVSP